LIYYLFIYVTNDDDCCRSIKKAATKDMLMRNGRNKFIVDERV